MAPAQDTLVVELYMADEMIAAGIEAKREAEYRNMPEAYIVMEIYMAMCGQRIKCENYGEEAFH